MNITNHILDRLEENPHGLKLDGLTTKFVKAAMLAESLRNMTNNGVLIRNNDVYSLNVIRPTNTVYKIDRSNAGLREMLIDEIEKLRAGRSTPEVSNAICNITSTILKSLALDLASQKLLSDKNNKTVSMKTIKLKG